MYYIHYVMCLPALVIVLDQGGRHVAGNKLTATMAYSCEGYI